ncbi:hypothetical protein B0I35DRAFT_445867 [Stachybotrys elegans]|uniref:Uncharacterized protein n=1 Tax=Stachybotrys elegans TaxID=80388 RepID=A0A8K0SHM1_9HYPO|nr:hypothetical protein B0I35DRAFT_445867 [Stachybotrys elegans]
MEKSLFTTILVCLFIFTGYLLQLWMKPVFGRLLIWYLRGTGKPQRYRPLSSSTPLHARACSVMLTLVHTPCTWAYMWGERAKIRHQRAFVCSPSSTIFRITPCLDVHWPRNRS